MAKDKPTRSSRKSIAQAFLHLVISGKIHEAYATHVRQDMKHHNPYYAGDAASLERGMQENDAEFPTKTIDIRHVLEDGNLVAVHSHVTLQPGQPGFATVHMFRFEGDRIVELWDIVQAIPEDSKNTNGMF